MSMENGIVFGMISGIVIAFAMTVFVLWSVNQECKRKKQKRSTPPDMSDKLS